MANCKNCGAELPQGSVFCQSCGGQVSGETAAAPPQVDVPQQPPVQQATQVFVPPVVPPDPMPYAQPAPAQQWAQAPESTPEPPPPPQAGRTPGQATQVFKPPVPPAPQAGVPDGKTRPVAAPPPAFPLAPSSGTGAHGSAPAGSLAVKKSGGRLFVECFLGLIIGGVMLLCAVTLLLPYMGASNFMFSWWNSFASTIPFAMALALTWHASGPDLSIGHVATLPAAFMALTGDMATGIILGLVAAIIVGFINAGFIYGLRLPSSLVSLVTAFLVYAFVGLLSDGQATTLNDIILPGLSSVLPIAVVAVAVVVVACYNGFTKVGVPFEKRTGREHRAVTMMLAYPLASVLAGLGGVLYAARTMVFTYTPNFSFTQIALVWAVLACTRLCDNRIGTAIGALAAALLSASAVMGLSMTQIFTFGLGGFAIQLFLCLMVLVLLIPAGLARWPFGKNSETRPLQQ